MIILYSIYQKSEHIYDCLRGHKEHRVDNYQLLVEDDESDLLLSEFKDTLSITPWKNENNIWVRGKEKVTKEVKVDDTGT
tara:strand:- start:584 stop:823 length:240 start_codon:yes stop_codon:yes gene_type:complete